MKLGLPDIRKGMVKNGAKFLSPCNLLITRLLWVQFPQQSRSGISRPCAALLLASYAGSYMTGADIVIAGGYTSL